MENLPNEILIEIFDYLDSRDIRLASNVSKRFNEIISNELKLLKKFKVQFKAEKIHNKWIGSRRYRNVFIDGSVAQHYLDIFRLIADDVKGLYINGNGMTMELLKQILFIFKNTKTISIGCGDDEVSAKPQDFLLPLPAFNFDYFEYYGTNDNFLIFANCQAKTARITRDYKIKSPNDENFKKFIKNQTHLESLLLGTFAEDSSLFMDKTLCDVQFKLKWLQLYHFDAYELPNFVKFIENFKYTLGYLELEVTDYILLEHFVDFRNLKKIALVKIPYMELIEPMKFVEELHIEDVKGALAENFPNVKKIAILDYLKKPSQVKNFKKLENLEVIDIEIAELRIPFVKKFTINNTRLICKRPFRYENNQIEELYIENCRKNDWLMEYLNREATNLKHLELNDIFVSSEMKRVIEQNKEKIDYVVYKNCIFEIMSFSIERLKLLKRI